jgi:hypothetical protein
MQGFYFEKKIIICFVNVETDPKLWYVIKFIILKTKKDPTIVQVFGMNVSWDMFNIPPSCIRNEKSINTIICTLTLLVD